MLLALGADANIRDDDGYSPLYFACRNGNEQCVSALLAHNADFAPTHDRRCPIRIAKKRGHLGCLKLIREWPAKRNQVAVKLCVSELKKQGMYEVVNAVPLNELKKEMFVYKVLDEMMSRKMYGLAEQVVSCVGIGKAQQEEE